MHAVTPSRRVGLLPISGDPTHATHIDLALAAGEALRLDEVKLILSPVSPHKVGQTQTPFHHRYALAQLALQAEGSGLATFITLTDMEAALSVAIGGHKYGELAPVPTFHTLKVLRQMYPADEFFLLLGSDQWRAFHTWENASGILDNAGIAITPRGDERQGSMRHTLFAVSYHKQHCEVADMGIGRWCVLDSLGSHLSSSHIRDALARGEQEVAGLIPAQLDYIRAHKLYGVK